jgi:primosomal protein N' (replication factor Y)
VHLAAPGDSTLADDAVAAPGVAVVRFPPAADRYPFLARVAADALRGHPADGPRSVLVVCPSVDAARRLAGRLDRGGLPVALVASDRPGTVAGRGWARAAAGGCVVVGARAAAWAPAPGLALAVVVDEHDEALQEERAPTWHARDVVVERARRHHVPVVLLSPCPSLEALSVGRLLVPSRRAERAGWPAVELVDRRDEDPATARSLLSPRLVAAIRDGGRVVCVLNRTGRARLLACRSCGELARCEECGAAVAQGDEGDLRCRRCGVQRPAVCAACGSGALKVARAAVGRLREELEALTGEPVDEVTATTAGAPARRVVIGTEAALHRVGRADVVAFCDMDQELTAPRFRAAEHALALIVRGARLVGGRAAGGRLLVQTRLPGHPSLLSALHADPGRLVEPELALRRELRFPPAAALALISGSAANAYVEALGSRLDGSPLELLGPMDGAWLARAPDHQVLADTLAATPRPLGRLRIEVDPRRV